MAGEGDSGNLALSGIGVEGFKSIRDRHDVELRQLTILAGANSSGKSSLMQPVLLLKQTVDATYDAGALRLDGPNVSLSRLEDAVWRGPGPEQPAQFTIRLAFRNGAHVEETFRRDDGKLDVSAASFCARGVSASIRKDMSPIELREALSEFLSAEEYLQELRKSHEDMDLATRAARSQCWLLPRYVAEWQSHEGMSAQLDNPFDPSNKLVFFTNDMLSRLIHLPGLRGSALRAYPLSASGPRFPGTFVTYAATLISDWKERSDARLEALGEAMGRLGLAQEVDARRLGDTKIEVSVGRTAAPGAGKASDLVNIADVGFGVSQFLPVAVALLAADWRNIVYVEQPELHLHPRAQRAAAGVIADAAKRGVQVVVETHSELLLMGIQTLVANGQLDPALVKLHWFERDPESGATTITSADLDENGAFGDWPQDFGRVHLDAQRDYLEAGYE